MIRVGRTEAERIAASFAAIPTLRAVWLEEKDGGFVVAEVEIGEADGDGSDGAGYDGDGSPLTARTVNGTLEA